MKASETKLIRIIEGTNQYLVPHFQRPYTWQRKDWETLWSDINSITYQSGALSTPAVSRDHFMGAIVTAPAHSVPEGVTKYLLIDGQQRLTTLLVLLAAVRDAARQVQDTKLAQQIQDLYLTNRFQDGENQFKLLPTQGDEPSHNDRSQFESIILGDLSTQAKPSGTLQEAFHHFGRMLRSYSNEQLTALANAILHHVLLVSIVLEHDDNPHAIFKSLNAKGQPLKQSDLVRNFFFMSIDTSRHDVVYSKKWMTMERRVGRDNLEAYIRHFLMMEGSIVRESDVYHTLKQRLERVGRHHAEALLDDLVRLSTDYARFLGPSNEPIGDVRDRLLRLTRLRATVCYPFLLRVFEDRTSGKIRDDEVVSVLDVLENFIVRRYVCGTMRAELNEVFPALYVGALRYSGKISSGIKDVLGSRNYPGDEEFFEKLISRKLYGAGEARDRAKLILERLEASWSTKEQVVTENLTIEHIMPQTLTPWWREHLGAEAEESQEVYLHTIGNLTLTGVNAELSNADFPTKRELLRQSKLALNAKVAQNERWTTAEINARAGELAKRALEVWPNFAPQASSRQSLIVRGTTPTQLHILDMAHEVRSWQDVLRVTLNEIGGFGADILNEIIESHPRHVNRSPSGMRSPRNLGNGVFYESNLNAESIYRLCLQIADIAGLSGNEWHVETSEA